jgi:hypothetical protein
MVSRGVLRLGGFAGIGVGLFILSFAFSDGVVGGLFAPEVLRGASAEAWLQRVAAHPDLARVAIALPMVGFALMLVVALVLYRLVGVGSALGTLGLAGFVVGVPVAVATFAAATSLAWLAVGMGIAASPELLAQWTPLATRELHRFMLVNWAVGPLFVVLTGEGCLALAAWRAAVLPRWLCGWGMANAALMGLGIASVRWPALAAAQLAGPLTMLWFVATGVVLLARAGSAPDAA